MTLFLAAMIVESAAAAAPNPDSCLLRVERTLELVRMDIPAMKEAADAAARRLADGGMLWVGGQPSMVNELSGRAGGFMMIQGLREKSPEAGDVVLFFTEEREQLPPDVAGSGALVVTFGGANTGSFWFANHARETGISPSLANAIPGWVFSGELVAALTRLGKMPVMYESIGAYTGAHRMQQYLKPRIWFHAAHNVKPVEHGVVGNRFVDAVGAMLRRVDVEERDELARAGSWAAKAHRAGKRLIMYSMGHLFPEEVAGTDIGSLFESALWNSGFLHQSVPDDVYSRGDVIVHVGYQHPPVPLAAEGARGRGPGGLRGRDAAPRLRGRSGGDMG